VNHGQEPFVVEPGLRMAQMVITRVEAPALEVVSELEETDRGTGGFGSTGC
ncbi:MAG: dUTP diphosphatase, partial [Myxococcota bacterium]